MSTFKNAIEIKNVYNEKYLRRIIYDEYISLEILKYTSLARRFW